MINIRNIEYIRAKDPKLYEAFKSIQDALPDFQLGAPPQVTAISVTAAGGIFDIAISDSGQPIKGVNYFLEYSLTPGFEQPTVVDLGASRQSRLNLGNLTLYWRTYSQYAPPVNSPASTPIVFGAPTPVSGGGAISGPSITPSTGSGTGATNGQQGGVGFGDQTIRPPVQ